MYLLKIQLLCHSRCKKINLGAVFQKTSQNFLTQEMSPDIKIILKIIIHRKYKLLNENIKLI